MFTRGISYRFMNLSELATTVVVSGVASSLAVWLLKEVISARLRSAIQHEYDAKLEGLKAALQSQNEVSLERLRSEFARTLRDYEIRLSNVQPRVADAIADAYAKVLRIYHSIEVATNIQDAVFEPARKKAVQEFYDAVLALQESFLPQRIYFSRDLADRITSLVHKLMLIDSSLARKLEHAERASDTNFGHDALDAAFNDVQREARPLLTELEEMFRQALGVARTVQPAVDAAALPAR